MSPKRVAVTVSLPPELAREFDKLAKDQAKNKSQLFRDMFRTYRRYHLEQEFYELQRYGAPEARKKGILTEADVEALVFQDR
ncbi:ribbon-helix-helix domain-containing protein [Acidobacteria bacterium AH-259-G07]|nr:ribbon-helix-helix domain-containing protein [Acidobacteria bacterium AH-259-L09]MDA2927670.1 ribbon-helix-helix domain-containing protein [Acidobacteria bacterium AH-259-G07]